jgi:uncharacterized protein YndB with AHSA1/START domain
LFSFLKQTQKDMAPTKITVQAIVNAPIEKVWKCWTSPEDIVKWNAASNDWHTTWADNHLEPGGKFNYRMEAKDGSFGFDFWGIYNKVVPLQSLEITLGDERKMSVTFSSVNGQTEVVETFDAEDQNPIELQREGWQAILNNFKKYVETKSIES